MKRQNKKIGIIGGNGKMGKFFRKFFEQNNFSVSIWDRKSNVSLQDFTETIDIILVSVPIDATEKVIQDIGKFLRSDQCITDITSLKQFPLEAMKRYTKAKFFGMHPMFAPPISGKMEGQNIIFCAGNADKEQKIFEEIFTASGAFCIHLESQEHDKIMSLIQGLSHFLDLTFIKTLEKSGIDVAKIFGSRSPAYAIKMMLAGRTLAQDANLYGNIQMQNPENKKTLQHFLDISAEIFDVVKQKNLPEYEKIFNTGKKFLGKYAEKSQNESDLLINFLAQRILKNTPEKKKFSHHKPSPHCVGILGPEHTFSHIAAQKFLGENTEIHLFSSIPAIFTALKKQEIFEAFVPIENILHGSVVESIDGIVKCGIPIQAIYEMQISPSFFVAPHTKTENITKIFSHPQALAQCSNFLEKNFPHAQYIPTHSTTKAIREILHTDSAAAIAAPEMMESYTVKVLAKDIANMQKNATRFILLSTQKFTKSSPSTEGAFIFALHKDTPGGLEKMLNAFSTRNINLTKIESRPTGEAFGEYVFFVTYSGKISEQEKENFLKEIFSLVEFSKFLGEYGIFTEK